MAGSEVQAQTFRDTAAAFVSARRAAASLSNYPGEIPGTIDDAYLIQDAAIALAALPIGGWKVGRIFPPHTQFFGSDRLTGPIFETSMIYANQAVMPVFAQGFAAAEAEYLLRVGTATDPGKSSYTLDEAEALIDAVHVGIEIASSPLASINDLGPAVTISDFGNNHGLVIGAAIPDWRNSDFAFWPVSVSIDGAKAGEGIANAMPDGPLGAARFLFEHMAARGIALSPGQWISSGAITGVHRVTPGARVEARFNDGERVSCTITAERER